MIQRSREATKRRARLVEICSSLPDVTVKAVGLGDQHRAFSVRKKTFAYYLFDHHGDGRIALCCKAAPGEQGRLVEEDPRRFFVPPYLGPKGWVGMRLDLASVDRSEIAYHVRAAYRLTAPRVLATRLK